MDRDTILDSIIKTISDSVSLDREEEFELEPLPPILDERNGKKLFCSLIKHERVFHLNGEVLLPDGNKAVDIFDYKIPGYFLVVKEFDTRKRAYTGRQICFLCGTIRYTVTRAWMTIKRARCHVLHVENILTEAGFPQLHEFDEFTKSPIKRKARKIMNIDGNSVSNRTVRLTGMEVVA